MCGIFATMNDVEIAFLSVLNHTIHRTKNQHVDIYIKEVMIIGHIHEGDLKLVGQMPERVTLVVSEE